MTDRVKGFTVTLDKNIRIDDVEFIQNAISAIVHVVEVEPIIADDPHEYITEARCKHEFRKKLLALAKEL